MHTKSRTKSKQLVEFLFRWKVLLQGKRTNRRFGSHSPTIISISFCYCRHLFDYSHSICVSVFYFANSNIWITHLRYNWWRPNHIKLFNTQKHRKNAFLWRCEKFIYRLSPQAVLECSFFCHCFWFAMNNDVKAQTYTIWSEKKVNGYAKTISRLNSSINYISQYCAQACILFYYITFTRTAVIHTYTYEHQHVYIHITFINVITSISITTYQDRSEIHYYWMSVFIWAKGWICLLVPA